MEEHDQDGSEHGIDVPELQISTDVKRGLIFKLVVLVVVVFLLPVVLWLLIQAYRPMTGVETVVFIIMSASFAGSLGAAVVYGGFVKQHLIVNSTGVTYIHRPTKRHIPWSKLKSVKLLGVNHPDVVHYGVLFSSKDTDINVASDFDRDDLLELAEHIVPYEKKYGFSVIEKE
jgi:hypothetical protein